MAFNYYLRNLNPLEEDIVGICFEERSDDEGKVVYINGDPSKLYELVYLGEDVEVCKIDMPPYVVKDVSGYFQIQQCNTNETRDVELLGGALQVGDIVALVEIGGCWEILSELKDTDTIEAKYTYKNYYCGCNECLNSINSKYLIEDCCTGGTKNVRILGGEVAIGDIISIGCTDRIQEVKASNGDIEEEVTLTGKLGACNECYECGGEGDNLNCIEDEERTIAYAVMVKLPKPPVPDKGFKECCYTNLVLADSNDNDRYKNDYTGFYFQKQTNGDDCDFILIELSTGDEYALNNGIYGVFKDFGDIEGNPKLTTYIVNWRKVLSVLGTGLYQVKKTQTIAGLQFEEISNTFTLSEYSDTMADKTIRIDAEMSGKLVHLGIDFKNSGFETSLRTNGFFGRRDPKYKQDNLVKRNYDTVQISMSQDNEYELQTNLIPECITEQVYDFILFGNRLYISDYNKVNHSYKYRMFEVELESNKGGKYYNKIRDAHLNLTFKDRFKNKRKINC